MVTPYGTNCFKYCSGRDSNGGLERGLLLTEPTGDHQAYAYQDVALNVAYGYGGADGNSLPYSYDGLYRWRLSFHWNRFQFSSVSSVGQANLFAMTGDDYDHASIKHWLHGLPTATMDTVCDTLDSSADPYDPVLGYRPNCLSYSYVGEGAPYINNGYSPFFQQIASIQWNGTTVAAFNRNSLGRPTNTLYFNSDSSIAYYTNVYDSSGQTLQTETGPRGELVRGYGYANSTITNLLTSVTNAVGDVLHYTHDTSTLKVTSITFPGGLVRTNIYYANGPSQGFLQQQIDIGFHTNSFTYTNGNLLSQTNELGLATTYSYDNLERLVSTAFPDATTISNVYDKLDVVAVKDRLNQWTHYVYNNVRQLTAATNVNGQVTTYDYCSCGSPDQITRWNASTPVTTLFSYDMQGRLTSASYHDGYQLNYVYDANDRVQTVTDSGGNQMQYAYYQHGLASQIQTVTLGSQQLLSQQFDEYGRLIYSVDRNSMITTNAYDFLDRLTARQSFGFYADQTGLESFAYNALGLTNYTDALGHPTTYGLDAAARVLYQTNANNEVLQFTYNPADEMLTLTDGKNQTTAWGYDFFGRVTNKLDALGNNIFSYQYDANDRLTNRWSLAKGGTTYKYDPHRQPDQCGVSDFQQHRVLLRSVEPADDHGGRFRLDGIRVD